MAGQFILGFFGAILVGVVLVVLGLRGRRVNRQPACRSCGFDLSGVLPNGVTCPECGAGLKRERAIRIGQRRRMWTVAAVGALLVILPAGGLATAVFVMLSGSDTQRYKPLGVLLWEVKSVRDAEYADALAGEFSRRRAAKALDESQELRVAEAVLALQADPERPWCEEFGDFIEMARIDGVVDDEHYDRFVRQGALIKVETRPSMRPGDPLPLVATLVEARIGSGSELVAAVWLTDLTLNGKPLPDRRAGPGEDGSSASQPFPPGSAVFMFAGSATDWAPGTTDIGDSVGVLATVPEDASPGPVSVGATLTYRVETIGPQTGYSFSPVFPVPRKGKGISVRNIALRARVISAGATPINLIDPSEELSEKLAAALVPNGIQARSSEQTLAVRIGFPVDKLSVPVACDVFWRVGEAEWKVGSFTSGSGVGGDATAGWILRRSSRRVSGSISAMITENAELVLKPNPDLALGTVDLTSIYSGEIIITDRQLREMGESFQVNHDVYGAPAGVPSGG